MHVVFLHPDLGVGGAERLIIDSAIAAQSNGNQVTIITNHYNSQHCFEDSKKFNIIVKYDFIPRQIFGKFHALFAYLKIFLASFWLLVFSGIKYDIIITDQISVPNVVFKIFSSKKVLYYCHFPDQLLCVYDRKKNFFKRLYRLPLDWLEMISTGMADTILVNSKFTEEVFHKTFPSLKKSLKILYPSLNTEFLDLCFTENLEKKHDIRDISYDEIQNNNADEKQKYFKKRYIFLSINRYERKKNLKLAIDAFLNLKDYISEELWNDCHLVHAGGYDPRVNENINYYDELKDYSKKVCLSDKISLLRSINDIEKVKLLKKSFCLIYTPLYEHFGIVPIEAMYCEKPVIATNTGGPLETVLNGTTGYLVKPDSKEFAQKMSCLILNKKLQADLGTAARKHVLKNFSFSAFEKNLNEVLNSLMEYK